MDVGQLSIHKLDLESKIILSQDVGNKVDGL